MNAATLIRTVRAEAGLSLRELAAAAGTSHSTRPYSAGGDVDLVDLEEMAAAGTLDIEAVLGVLTRYLGGDDPRIDRLRALDTA